MPFSLFSVYGIEIEYMIVDKQSLEISPYTDKLFEIIHGSIENEIERGDIALNNELALHVLELKTNGPKTDLTAIEQSFHQEILSINKILDSQGKVLLPTATHPWTLVDNVKLWPHGDKTIYNTYDSIFNCQGHGWSNLQSTHLNLPFGDEEEFIQLHNAIRYILPLIPALAASSPFCEGKKTKYKCSRLKHYESNQKIIPSITGEIVPEWVGSVKDYYTNILNPMYKAIDVHDKNKILQYEWLNSRGAIARFDRNAIEIRVIDSQECALMDMTIVAAIVGAIKFVMERTEQFMNKPLETTYLKKIMDNCVLHGSDAEIADKKYLEHIGLKGRGLNSAKDIWESLVDTSSSDISSRYQQSLEVVLRDGNLSERLIHSLTQYDKIHLKPIYTTLTQCLQENKTYLV